MPNITVNTGSSKDRGIYVFFYEIFSRIAKIIKLLLGGINKHFGKVLAFLAFLLLLFLLFAGGFGLFKLSINSKKESRQNAAYKEGGQEKWYSKLFSNASSMTNVLGSKAYSSVPREVEENGRCDNVSLVSARDSSNNISICMDTSFKRPAPARFTINPNTVSEFEMLPSEIKKRIRSDTNRLTITVPYRYNEVPSAYVLDFSKATYGDGKPANDLFNERFDYDYWNFKPKSLNATPSGKRYKYAPRNRPVKTDSTYKGLSGYV